MSLFHTNDGSDDRLPITFYTDDVIGIRDFSFADGPVQSEVTLLSGLEYCIPESEGRRLRDVLELELATEDEIELCFDHEQIAMLTEASETNPEVNGFRIRVKTFNDVPAAQIDL